MEIFNIGPLELLLIITIALIVLGPDEMIRTGRKLARTARKIIRSPIWKSLIDTSQEIRGLPKKFIREAGLDETVDELNKVNKQMRDMAKKYPLNPANGYPKVTTETKQNSTTMIENGEAGGGSQKEKVKFAQPVSDEVISESKIVEKPSEDFKDADTTQPLGNKPAEK